MTIRAEQLSAHVELCSYVQPHLFWTLLQVLVCCTHFHSVAGSLALYGSCFGYHHNLHSRMVYIAHDMNRSTIAPCSCGIPQMQQAVSTNLVLQEQWQQIISFATSVVFKKNYAYYSRWSLSIIFPCVPAPILFITFYIKIRVGVIFLLR